jgi:pimeloyl-ACP methyl ester carboxylesterase
MPLLFLLNWIFGLFTLGFVVLDIYLFRKWYLLKDEYLQEHARYYLIAAIALLAFMFFGRMLIKLFTGKAPAKGAAEPNLERSKEFSVLERPDGSRIQIEYEGPEKGPILLMIHGWGNDCTEWYYQKKQLSKKYRLVLFDLPGLGKSSLPRNGECTVAKYSKDLQAIIEYLNQDVILWGHSIGGMIILTYFKNHHKEAHEKVKAIILEHTTYTNPMKTSALSGFLTAIQKPIIEPLLYLHIFLSPYYRIKNWLNYFNGNLHISNAITSFAGTQTRGMVDVASLYTALASPAVVAKGMLDMLNKYDVTHSLKSIKTATLIIAAKEDLATKPEASMFIHKEISGSTLVSVTPGGHMSVFERHLEVGDAADRFIRSLS